MMQETAFRSVQLNAFADDGCNYKVEKCFCLLYEVYIETTVASITWKSKEQAEDECRVGRLVVGVM
jgi:hypothetical protein